MGILDFFKKSPLQERHEEAVRQQIGIQINIARRNMLEAGVELPGLRLLKKGLEVLKEELGLPLDRCETKTSHTDAWGDPAGDNKVSFRCPQGREIVLKLKVAPDITTSRRASWISTNWAPTISSSWASRRAGRSRACGCCSTTWWPSASWHWPPAPS